MTARFDEAWASAAGVDGWLTERQARVLFDSAARCRPDGRIVEIGSFQGRSTIVLALAAPRTTEIVAIDPHAGTDRGPQEIDGFAVEAADDHARFEDNLTAAGVRDRVRHVRRFSHDALTLVDGRIDVLYVDGAHRFRPALADIRAWGGRVSDGGSMLVHDSFSSVGVTLAILRELVLGRRFRYVGRERSLAVYRADLGGEWVGNALRQLAQLPWFARNLALKVLLTAGLGAVMRRLGRRPPAWPY